MLPSIPLLLQHTTISDYSFAASSSQAPPLHIHLKQHESFLVTAGQVCTTMDYALSDQTWTPQDPIQTIIPYRPHRFWPCPSATEDSTILIWAHPSNAESAMDGLFFMNLLRWISDVKDPAVDVGIDIFQLSLLEYVLFFSIIFYFFSFQVHQYAESPFLVPVRCGWSRHRSYELTLAFQN